jgi:hypothetical protein
MEQWNREQLHKDVSDHPVSRLTEKYGASDVAIAKACRKLQVPWLAQILDGHIATFRPKRYLFEGMTRGRANLDYLPRPSGLQASRRD